MCGIAGIMYKESRLTGLAPIGDELVKMLETMVHRGHDSAGVTVSGESLDSDLLIRIWADESSPVADTIERAKENVEPALFDQSEIGSESGGENSFSDRSRN